MKCPGGKDVGMYLVQRAGDLPLREVLCTDYLHHVATVSNRQSLSVGHKLQAHKDVAAHNYAAHNYISSMECSSIQFGKQNRHPRIRAMCWDSQAIYVFSVAKLQGGFLVSWNLQAATICLCLWSGSITTRRLLPPPVWGQLLPPHQLLQARTTSAAATSGLAGPLPLLLPAPPPPPPPPSRCRSCAPTQ